MSRRSSISSEEFARRKADIDASAIVGNRSRLLSNSSYDPDVLTELTTTSVLGSEDRAPKLKRTGSGTNLSKAPISKSLRKNRYSFGDDVPGSGVGGFYELPAPDGSLSTSKTSSTVVTRTNSTSGTLSRTSSTGGTISRTSSVGARPAVDANKLQSILAARKPNIKKYPGKSIESIKTNPSNFVDGHLTKNMSIISNFIVIGGREDAGNRIEMQRLGITHILNCAQQVPNYFPDDFIYESIPILDDEKTDIGQIVSPTLRFLGEVEELQGRCLVHCVSGVSRSVTAVIIYLMHKHNMCLRHSFDFLKSCRPFICPNEGFKLQLAKMEVDLFGYSTVSKKAGKPWEFYGWNQIKGSFKYQEPSSLLEKSSSVCTLS